MTLQKDALRNAGVLNFGLKNVQSVVLKVIINVALAQSVVFIWAFDNRFLKECVKVEHLKSS